MLVWLQVFAFRSMLFLYQKIILRHGFSIKNQIRLGVIILDFCYPLVF